MPAGPASGLGPCPVLTLPRHELVCVCAWWHKMASGLKVPRFGVIAEDWEENRCGPGALLVLRYLRNSDFLP